jgi:predicted nucleic acid-binding protein
MIALDTNAWSRLRDFQGLFPLVQPTAAVFHHARELHLDRGVSFWDAMILSACVEAGIETLYTEDIPGLELGTPKVVNPFL